MTIRAKVCAAAFFTGLLSSAALAETQIVVPICKDKLAYALPFHDGLNIKAVPIEVKPFWPTKKSQHDWRTGDPPLPYNSFTYNHFGSGHKGPPIFDDVERAIRATVIDAKAQAECNSANPPEPTFSEPPTEFKAADFRFRVSDLTSQSDTPFIFAGQPAGPEMGVWKRYRRAVEAHPTALSCLKRSEQGKRVVDLRNFDWKVPRKIAGLDVCLFRTLTTLKDPQLIEAWLRFHDFRVSPATKITRKLSKYQRNDPYYTVTYITGFWTAEQYETKRKKLRFNLNPFITLKNFSLSIELNKENQVVGTSFFPNTK